jgi:diguanylate cyclase (GGDEF) domain
MSKRRKIVGILISDAHHKFFRQCLCSVQKELLRNDIDVITFTTLCHANVRKGYADAECSVYEVMDLCELDGLIVYPTTYYMEQQKAVMERIRREFDKPVVCLEHENEYGFPTVSFGRENGMELLVDHLVKQHGARDIRLVAGHSGETVPFDTALREDFLTACDKHGIPAKEEDFYDGGFWIHTGDDIAEKLQKLDKLPDAVICVSDEGAAALIAALEKRGIRVPEDIIVAGYGADEDRSSGEYLTVYRDPVEMASNAVRMLIALMEGKGNFLLQHRDNCCRLIRGGSCGCVRSSCGPYSERVLEELRDATERFPSEYNFMSEEITNATDFEECLRTVDEFTRFLGDYEAFYLCLNANALHETEAMTHITDKVELAIAHEKDSSVLADGRMFNREYMIPALYRESEKPRVFYVAALHFIDRVLGYIVLSYGSDPRVFDVSLRGWLRKLAHCLEAQRRWYMYDDMTLQNQVRDAMTGLYNYKGYIGALQDMYRHLGGVPTKLCVIAIDIERFSAINDAFGRDEGNEVLLALTKIIQNAMNDRDICARFGNDEFVVAGFYETDNDATGLLSNLNARLQNYNNFNKKSYSVNLTYAKVCEDVIDEDSLAAITADAIAAKKALKENKRYQNGGTEVVNEEERREVQSILDDNLLTYHFQPIVSAKTGEIYSYEALMRSRTESSLAPEVILKYAESMDRLYDVERHTFFNTLALFRENRERLHGRKLFINSIPKVVISDKDYTKLIANYSDVLPDVVIEFTEQTEASLEQVQLIKERCAQNGMQLAIDDYGAGYSNISNLLNYAPDYVKIDRSLIAHVDEDNKKQYFVSNTVEFAHENGFLALAEGVETREELNTVIRLGIDLVQGYYTGRPSEDFTEEIPKELTEDIVRMNIRNIDTRQKKTYIVGNESEVLLVPLVMDGYTEVVVPKPECILVGNPKYQTDIVIHVPDNTISRIHLRGAQLESYQRRPCLEIGNRSDVTLVVEGNVTMQDAGIRVPESSSLTIEGNGKLYINVSADRSFAIGGDCNQSVGRIAVNMDGEMTIHGDGRECVGIGGGYLRDTGVRIESCRNLYLTMTGEQVVGIGSACSTAPVVMQNARVIATINSDRGVAVGSIEGEPRVEMLKAHFTCVASGDTQIAVGSLLHEQVSVRVTDCEIQTEMRAKRCVGIGCRTGSATVRVINSVINTRCEGSLAIGIGSGERKGRGQFEMSNMIFRLASASGIAFGYEEESMNFLKCSIVGSEESKQ